jgi:hypothetical protein
VDLYLVDLFLGVLIFLVVQLVLLLVVHVVDLHKLMKLQVVNFVLIYH